MSRCLPILMYHHVNPVGNFINVTPERFEAQMRYLFSYGYKSLTISDLERISLGQTGIPSRSIMITFDDGWLDNWFYAYPIMKKYGLRAVLFVVTSWVSEEGIRKDIQPLPSHRQCLEMMNRGYRDQVMLSWGELKEMEDSGVFDIQSHTHSHIRWDKNYNDPDTYKEALRKDLERARLVIKERLGKEAKALCWPWGINKPWYQDVAIEAGYKFLFTTEKGCNTLDDFKSLKRIVIGNISILDFRKKLLIHSNKILSRAYLRLFGK